MTIIKPCRYFQTPDQDGKHTVMNIKKENYNMIHFSVNIPRIKTATTSNHGRKKEKEKEKQTKLKKLKL